MPKRLLNKDARIPELTEPLSLTRYSRGGFLRKPHLSRRSPARVSILIASKEELVISSPRRVLVSSHDSGNGVPPVKDSGLDPAHRSSCKSNCSSQAAKKVFHQRCLTTAFSPISGVGLPFPK